MIDHEVDPLSDQKNQTSYRVVEEDNVLNEESLINGHQKSRPELFAKPRPDLSQKIEEKIYLWIDLMN